ncbi:hypothetical protein LUZ63_012069 [Rhynchospora breviuscula]|uniref:KIB1-4 beta-propeller domain-containing protein n=1 Tax=Rhynchospora breviuscula TaxID=2022672 RepID=A0A9Q0CK51_9POAL|nr:hypothetical protein LUZ63_012069 [Rhynchospora breviuscula]
MYMSWSELPPELLAAIAEKLTEPGDHLRFRCVCSKWLTSTHCLTIPPFQKIPWLILPSDLSSSSSYHLYSFSEDRLNKLCLPHCAQGSNLIRGSTARGWLLASRNDQLLHLINPFNPYYVKSKFSMVMNYYSAVNHLSWDISPLSDDAMCCPVSSRLYNVRHYKGVKSITHCEALTGKGPDLTADLVVSPDDMYLLVKLKSCDLTYSHIFWMDRHRAATGEQWTEVAGIGNHAIFVDGLHCFLVEAGGSTGLEKNCVYSVISKHHNMILL